MDNFKLEPDELLNTYITLFDSPKITGPILDLACGDGHNGIFLAKRNLKVICCDISAEALEQVRKLATMSGAEVETWQVDLEKDSSNPLPPDYYGGMVVFRYLHRPLINCIKKSIKKGGVLVYETYTFRQACFGKPHNPNFLLNAEELRRWFADWDIIHYFEGIKENPKRAVAQIVCRK